MNNNSFSILIPSFNGLHLLKKHLPSVIKYSPKSTPIFVVDDGSIDGTEKYLKEEFPKVIVIHNEKNLGFTKSVNKGVESLTTDFVVLLNNDVEPTNGYLDNIFSKFDQNTFAVNFNETNSSWPVVSWNGKLDFIRSSDKSKPYLTAWASGGSAVFSRNLWKVLGGFDPVFSPGYWEDIDLGWRAWKAGYKIIIDPKSVVVHEHESTFNALDKNFVINIKQRNELLFIWKNFTEPYYQITHFWFLFTNTLFHPGYLKIIISALMSVSKVKLVSTNKISNKKVFELVNQPYES